MVVQFADQLPDNPHKIIKAHQYKFPGVEDMQADLKDKLKTRCPHEDYFTHTAICPGLNVYRNLGYIVKAREDVTVDKLGWPGKTYTDHFKKWENSHILKVPTWYVVYIPEGYSMIFNPIAHSEEEAWYAVPGIFERYWGPTFLSVFLTTTNKNLFLPAGTPLAQMFFVPDEQPEVEFREYDTRDNLNMIKREELMGFGPNTHKPFKTRMKDTNKGNLMDYPWYHWD